MILDWDTSLPSAPPEHLLSTPSASASPDSASRVFVASLWVLKGPGEDNLTGRNWLLPGRSVYSSPSALGAAACTAGARLARRLTALSGPIHCEAADSSHLPRSPAERSEISGAETLPSDGAQWLMHRGNCWHSSPNSETSFHKRLFRVGGAGQDSCMLMLLETSQQGARSSNLRPTSRCWWIKEENKPKRLSD